MCLRLSVPPLRHILMANRILPDRSFGSCWWQGNSPNRQRKYSVANFGQVTPLYEDFSDLVQLLLLPFAVVAVVLALLRGQAQFSKGSSAEKCDLVLGPCPRGRRGPAAFAPYCRTREQPLQIRQQRSYACNSYR